MPRNACPPWGENRYRAPIGNRRSRRTRPTLLPRDDTPRLPGSSGIAGRTGRSPAQTHLVSRSPIQSRGASSRRSTRTDLPSAYRHNSSNPTAESQRNFLPVAARILVHRPTLDGQRGQKRQPVHRAVQIPRYRFWPSCFSVRTLNICRTPTSGRSLISGSRSFEYSPGCRKDRL